MVQPIEPNNGPLVQYRYNLEAYNTWFEKDHNMHVMLSSMYHDLIKKYEYYPNICEISMNLLLVAHPLLD